MRLEGSLDAFSLPDILALLSMTKKTGTLHLQRPGAHGAVHVSDGRVTGASADVSRQLLGRRLAAHVDEDALARAVASARANGGGIAPALVAAGAVDRDVAAAVVSEQIADAVFELLRWTAGDFGFDLDAGNPDDVGVSVDVEDVVADARRRLEAWPQITAVVPSPDTVLTVALAPEAEPAVNRDEWALLALVDGRRSVADLVGLAGRGEFAVVSALAGLVSRGLLVASADAGVAALLRRQAVLAELETAATPPATGAPAAPAVSVPHQPPAAAAAATVPAPPAAEPAVPVGRAEPAFQSGHAEPTQRVPAQPAAGLDSHPTVGATAVAPAVGPDRDPAINRSLLLRLIAGVQGL